VRGTLRWVRADLRARRAQAIATTGVVAGVVSALVLSTMLLAGAINPWRELFARTHGADADVYFKAGTPLGPLATIPGIQAVSAPYSAAPATVVREGQRSPAELRAIPALGSSEPRAPAMSAPLVTAGTWLRPGNTDGVVVESSFAASVHITVGSVIEVDGIDGTQVIIRVIGVADTADQGFYPQWTPGLIWVQAPLLRRVEPVASETEEVAALRLADPGQTGVVVQQVFNAYNGASESSPVQRVITRQEVMNSMASDDRLLGLLLALIGIIALVAAPCAIANVTAGRVLIQRQDLAMLKALGFTPGQVIRMLVAEQTALGLAGTALGLLAARVVTSPAAVIILTGSTPAGTPVTFASLPLSATALIAAGAMGTVALATAIPAWRAGLVSPVAAVRPAPPRGHLSLLTRLSLLLKLPPALVLGTRDAVIRRLPAALTVLGIAIPTVMITIALACESTISSFTHDPARIGLAATIRVSPGALQPAQLTSMLRRDPDVRAVYPGAEFDTLLPGDNGTFVADAMGSSRHPYPFPVVQGRMYAAPDEAVAGQGLLDLLKVRVGAWISPTIDGVPVIFHIVGRTLDASGNGDVLAFGLDALSVAGGASQPAFWSVELKPGVSAEVARAHLLAVKGAGEAGGQLDVTVLPNPADGLGVVRVVIVIAVVVLGLIGLANLLTATAIGLRDHLHEAGVLQAMGLTPRQVIVTRVVSAAILTLAGVTAGIAVGLAFAPRLINAQGAASGIGWGIATGPSPVMVAGMVATALLAAILAALFLAAPRFLSAERHGSRAEPHSRMPRAVG
jgi:putative ABC transport system permease protein